MPITFLYDRTPVPKLQPSHDTTDNLMTLCRHSPLCVPIILEYSQEYLRSKIGRKIEISSMGRKKQYFFAIKGLLLDSYCSDMTILWLAVWKDHLTSQAAGLLQRA